MTLFLPDKKFLVTFLFDGQTKQQQLNLWRESSDLDKTSAQRRIAYQRGLEEKQFNRIAVKEIRCLHATK